MFVNVTEAYYICKGSCKYLHWYLSGFHQNHACKIKAIWWVKSHVSGSPLCHVLGGLGAPGKRASLCPFWK